MLGVFRRVVDLLVGEEVLALVLPEVGDGPFRVVVDRLPPVMGGETIRLSLEEGAVAPARLGRATSPRRPYLWDPRPPWEALKLSSARLQELRELLSPSWESPFAGGAGDDDTLLALAATLAGRGSGLTPAGDDALAGLMLALWAHRGAGARPLCARIVGVAAPRTTRLSGAFLRSAAEGWADARWHALLHALAGDAHGPLVEAARAVLDFGASSGREMLAGFLGGTFDL